MNVYLLEREQFSNNSRISKKYSVILFLSNHNKSQVSNL